VQRKRNALRHLSAMGNSGGVRERLPVGRVELGKQSKPKDPNPSVLAGSTPSSGSLGFL